MSKPYATTFGGLAALLAGILWLSWVLIGLFLNPILTGRAPVEDDATDDAARPLFPRRVRAGNEHSIAPEPRLRVGKPGQLGGSIRCVVSVSMLTEGWDANTVTHVLGIRAFGSKTCTQSAYAKFGALVMVARCSPACRNQLNGDCRKWSGFMIAEQPPTKSVVSPWPTRPMSW